MPLFYVRRFVLEALLHVTPAAADRDID